MLTGGKRYIGCCVVGQSLDGPVPVQQHFCNMLLDTLFLGARDGPLKASSRRGGVGWSCWGRRPCGGDCWPWGTGQKSGWHLSRTSHLKRFYETQWPHSKQRIQSVQFDISSHTYTTTIKMTDSPCSNCPHVHYSPSLLPSPTPSQGFTPMTVPDLLRGVVFVSEDSPFPMPSHVSGRVMRAPGSKTSLSPPKKLPWGWVEGVMS